MPGMNDVAAPKPEHSWRRMLSQVGRSRLGAGFANNCIGQGVVMFLNSNFLRFETVIGELDAAFDQFRLACKRLPVSSNCACRIRRSPGGQVVHSVGVRSVIFILSSNGSKTSGCDVTQILRQARQDLYKGCPPLGLY